MKINLLERVRYSSCYRFVKRIYAFLNSEFYPTAHIYLILYCMKHKDYQVRKVDLYSLEDYCRSNGYFQQVLVPAEYCNIYKKQYWNKISVTSYEKKMVPDVFSIELQGVSVIGDCNYIIKRNRLLVSNYTQETSSKFIWTNSALKIKYGKKGELRYKKSLLTIDKGLYFSGGAVANYYHFMLDTLPRLALCEENDIYTGWSILIDSKIKEIPQLVSALEVINKSHHSIIWLEDNVKYDVECLAYISAVTWTPMNMRQGLWPQGKDYAFCATAVRCMKNMIVEKCNKVENDKIYVARYRTGKVRLINDKETADLCKKYGFTVIFPEELSFMEQVTYFYNAKCVIACAGAACTNAIFCTREAKMYMIVPHEHESLLWPTVIGNVGAALLVIDAEISRKAAFAAGDEFIVDLDEVKDILEKL